jgi:hypothetical protein
MTPFSRSPGPGQRALHSLATILLSACFVSRAALADEPPAEADALFKSGLEQMRAGHYEVACPMLAKSYQLDPLPGALFTEADCEAAWGKVATAIEHYQAFVNTLTTMPAERRAKFDERRNLALEKVAALGPLAPELAIDVSLAPPNSMVIKRNGIALDRATYGVSRRVDPGDYAVTAEVDGKLVWERHLTLSQGDRARVDVPWLESPKSAPTPPPAPAPAPAPVRPAHSSGGSGSSTGRTVAYFAGGIGLGGLVAGAVTGILALQDKSTIDENCPQRRCSAAGHDAVESARASATVSTIGFSVGLAGAVGAVVLWLASDSPKKGDEARATVRPIVVGTERGAALGIGGTFR